MGARPGQRGNGNDNEMMLERSYKNGPGENDWAKQQFSIPNSALPDLIAKLQQGKGEFIDQQQQAQARAR